MKTKLALAVVALAGAALAWDWWQQGGNPQPMVTSTRDALPQEVRMLIHPTKPVTVVHLWATWCPPCMVEMPGLLEELKTPRAGVAVVMVSLDTSSTVLDAFYRKNRIIPTKHEARWLHDPSQRLAQQIESPVVLPVTVAYTRDGGVVQVVRERVAWPSFLKTLEKDRR